jgi:hypothetical protein
MYYVHAQIELSRGFGGLFLLGGCGRRAGNRGDENEREEERRTERTHGLTSAA